MCAPYNPSVSSAKQRSRRRLAALFLAAPLGLVLAEVGFRVYAERHLPAYTRAAILARSYEDDALDDTEDSDYGVVPHPYLGYVERPGSTLRDLVGDARLVRQVGPGATPAWLDLPANTLGFVTPQDLPLSKGPDEHLVVILGGSVARWFALQGGPRLEALLEEDPRLAGRDVVLFNAANPAHKQPQTLFALGWLLALGLEPDAVVEIGGLNEVTIAHGNVAAGVASSYPHHTFWAHVLGGAAPTREMLRAAVGVERARITRDANAARARSCARLSNTIAYLFARRADDAQADIQRHARDYLAAAVARMGDDPAFTGPVVSADLLARKDELVAVWARGVRALTALCRGLDIDYVHVLHPAAHDWAAGPSKPFTPEELAAIGPRDHPEALAITLLYPALRARGAELAQEGVPVRDLSRLFENVAAPLYYDPGHFDQGGNEVLAEGVAEALLAGP